MTTKLKAILKSIIKDMASTDGDVVFDIATTMRNQSMIQLLLEAGCPQSIIFAIRDSLPLSYLERKYCATKILSAVKKIPTKSRD